MGEEEILTQEEDELEEDMTELEEEEKKEEGKTKTSSTKKPTKEIESEVPSETYEGFTLPARLGIMNTVTGETIEGFETGKDEGIVQLGKAILNKLDKIAIASGV